MAAPQRQLPVPGEVFLDHVAWFVPDMAAAEHSFTRLGFTLTPFTAQSNAGPDGPVATGTGNRCVMLRAGYLEVLTTVPGRDQTAGTDLARQLDTAIGRYLGVHVVAFTTADAEAERDRLQNQGFEPLPVVHLRRPVEGANLDGEAAFTVVRLPPGAMPEGRIQFLTHHTPDKVWQRRFMAEDNAVIGLTGVLMCVEDVEEAARRFGRFTGRSAEVADDAGVIALDRGRLIFVSPERCRALVSGIDIPAMPYIAMVMLASRDVSVTRSFLEGHGVHMHALGAEAVLVPAAEAMGATLAIHGPDGFWPGIVP